MDYLVLIFSEILQYKVKNKIHFELIPTSTSRDELGKLSGQRGQGRVKSTGKTDLGLLEIKLQLLTPTRQDKTMFILLLKVSRKIQIQSAKTKKNKH